MDNPQTPEQIGEVLYTTGYLGGYIDALALVQEALFEGVFPSTHFSEKEQNEFAKKFNFNRVNIPKSGIAPGQLMLIYKKYAEAHPEGLNGSTKICIFEAIVKAYGWK
jgi:hypothetical protein